uniref:Uncharacterized protein n=1 Tax=viral metagenome TaxID=1070528 RepID=A0A6H1ZKD7_9ZZZZ
MEKTIEELVIEKIEKQEKTLLLYIIFRNELELKCKADMKIPSEKQLHEYAFNKLIKENLL